MIAFLKRLFSRSETVHPLPIGRAEYEAWSERIYVGAAVPGLTRESANFALTSMLLHLPSTESMKGDAFFVHALRKAAVNQTAYEIMKELEQFQKARMAQQQAVASATVAPDASESTGPTSEKGSGS